MRDAADAAARAGVVVRELVEVDEFLAVDRLFSGVWGGDSQDAVSVNMMRALSHTGNYLAGAYHSDRLVGACVGFTWGGRPSLHSHVTGVDPAWQSHGVGTALKAHQRAWATGRGLREITWTYDPLVRRNGWFNLVKLGARAVAYYADFYGPMNDGINGGDPTDRCLVIWAVDGAPPPAPGALEAAHVLLFEDESGEPVVAGDGLTTGAPTVLCQVPVDAVALRRRDPALGQRWRRALRQTMGRAIQDGYVTRSITEGGYYVLTKDGP